MGFFDFLPEFDKCCFCIPLKIGCFLVGILAIFFNSNAVGHGYAHQCDMEVFQYIFAGADLILLIAIIILLIGLCVESGVCAEIFMWVYFLAGVVGVGILIVAGIIAIGKCRFPYYELPAICIIFLISLYFIAVVNSHKKHEGM